jgi:hypothetical protein
MTTSGLSRITATLAGGLVVAGLGAGCAGPGDEPAPDATTKGQVAASAPGAADAGAPAEADRSRDEKEFLDDLSGRGVPTDLARDTAVEVGLGICRGIAEGADADAVLERLRPLTSALAAQGDADATEVGRAFLDASRSHLC